MKFNKEFSEEIVFEQRPHGYGESTRYFKQRALNINKYVRSQLDTPYEHDYYVLETLL